MTDHKRVTDHMRLGRRQASLAIGAAQELIKFHEHEAETQRNRLEELRAQHYELGEAIKHFEGDAAELDFPEVDIPLCGSEHLDSVSEINDHEK